MDERIGTGGSGRRSVGKPRYRHGRGRRRRGTAATSRAWLRQGRGRRLSAAVTVLLLALTAAPFSVAAETEAPEPNDPTTETPSPTSSEAPTDVPEPTAPAPPAATEDPTESLPPDDVTDPEPSDDATEVQSTTAATPASTTTAPEARDEPVVSPLSVNTPGTYIHQSQTWYAYVDAAENLDVEFVKANSSGGDHEATVRVRGPGGFDQDCTVPAGAAIGTACALTNLSTGTAGVWQIDYSDPVANSNRYTWAIDVQAGTTSIDGRVYSERYSINQFSGSPPVDFSFWYQSAQGFLYEATYTDYNGINSTFASDASGLALLDTCVSAYESADILGPSDDRGRLWWPAVLSPGECGDPYKIFFEQPDTDLPATADLWDGSTVWLQPDLALPSLSNLSFTSDSTAVRSGEFSFDVVDFTGQLDVQIDVDGDGTYDDPADRVVPAAVTRDGTVTVAFDGLDGQGDPIPATQDLGAQVAITRAGEIHFTNSDVETRAGLEVEALNGPDVGSFALYWNDTDLDDAGRIGTVPPMDGTGGVDSSGGAHGWVCTDLMACNANSGTGGSWGDGRWIDDWTYHSIDASEQIDIPGELPPPLPECDTRAFHALTEAAGDASDWYSLDLITADLGLINDGLGVGDDMLLNAVGYNVVDDRIYGIESGTLADPGVATGHVVVIGADGTGHRLGPVAGLAGAPNLFAGDVSSDGVLHATGTDSEIYRIDVDPNSAAFLTLLAPALDRVDSDGDAGGVNAGLDMAFGPGGLLYALRNNGELVTIDPATGEVDLVGAPAGLPGAAPYGAVFFDADGYFYAYDNDGGDVYRIDIAADEATVLADDGLRVGGNDGARCPNAPLPVDLGDAPAPGYGTLVAADGPRHSAAGYDRGSNTAALMLGASIDIESDGRPGLGADGDDTTDAGDEDAVADGIVLLPGQSTTVTVNATNTSGDAATLVGWIDLDNDGTFEATEWESVPVPDGTAAGDFDLTFDPPTFIGDGTYARFRLFPGTVTDPTPTGPAAAGEVEDHLVTGPLPEPLPACDARAFQGIATTSADPSDWYSVDLVTGAFGEINIGMGPEDDIQVNALGYSMADDRIYGIETRQSVGGNTGYVVVIANDGVGYRLGPLDEIADFPGQLNVGDVSPDGVLYATGGSAQTVFLIDVDPDSPDFLTVDTLTRSDGDADAGGIAVGFDWAFSPSGELYGVRNSGQLVTMDPDTGELDLVGQVANLPTGTTFGAVYFDASGALYAYQNGTGDIYRIDVASTTATPFSEDGITVSNNDGARCPLAPVPLDFGDAPESYRTLLADAGPRHAIPGYDAGANTGSVMLGSSIDLETDGQPNAAADGDDTTDAADEDGVALNPALGRPQPTLRTGLDPVSSQPVENTVEVEASANGFVSVWVDWNIDGDFDDAGEQVAAADAVAAGTNDITFARAAVPDGIATYVRVRYSTDADAVAEPRGPAPDGEVEDLRVLVERLNQPDACTETGTTYHAFTFSDPVAQTGTGDPGSSARYADVAVVDGVAVDMVAEVTAGTMNPTNAPPNGFRVGDGSVLGTDDAQWQVSGAATIRYSFYVAGTTDPVAVDAVFTVSDMDGVINEMATFDAADLASYAVTRGSAVSIVEDGGSVEFHGNGAWNGDPESRFQVVLEGLSSLEVAWRGSGNSGFGFDGDGDLGIDPPACEDWGDAPDSYGTTAAENGPNHRIVDGLFLGSAIDVDTDGQPTPGADGDDVDRLADEDGVAAPIALTAGADTTVQVTATNTTGGAAVLAGWIDLDNSGTFDADELQAVPVPDGTTGGTFALTFGPPTAYGDTHARFRLFPDGTATTPTGPAPGGEVEDHPVTGAVLEAWDCLSNAPGLLFQAPNADPTIVQEIEMATGRDEPVEEIAGRDINAVAYNVLDDYVYGWDIATQQLVRVGGDGNVEDLGVPQGLPRPPYPGNPGFNLGDIDEHGHYWVMRSIDDTWYRVDLDADSPTYLQVVGQGAVQGGGVNGYTAGADWAYVPGGGDYLYRVMADPAGTEPVLLALNRSTGEHEFFGALAGVPNDGFGAVFADADGFLYISDNRTGEIFRIDVQDVTATFFAQGPASGRNDGARCASSPILLDFGDAPDGYRTALADAGPRHGIPDHDATSGTAPLMLGDLIDPETDGVGTTNADGDDTSGTADEDGVADPIVIEPEEPSTVTVTVTNDTGEPATLAGWIDLDGSDTFDPGELATAIVPATTTTDVDLDFPAGTVRADTSARFRLFPGEITDPAAILPTGAAAAGEVEDYSVAVGLVHYEKTVDPADVAQIDPDDTFTYTVTVTNLGSVPLEDLSFTDDLADVVDDAEVDDASVTADLGTATYDATAEEIRWELGGDVLAVGAQAVVQYEVTVDNPIVGDRILLNAVVGTGPGSNCTENPAVDPDCFEEVPQPDIDGVKTSDATGSIDAGETITYEFTITNVGPGPAANAVVEDDLSGVLDEATYNGDAAVVDPVGGHGRLTYDAPNRRLIWNGPLDTETGTEVSSVTIRYTVIVNEADELGDGVLENALITSECPAPPIFDDTDPGFDPDCVEVVPIAGWTAIKTSDTVGDVRPGGTVQYTVEVANTGQVDLTGIGFTDDLSGVLDDATFESGDESADEGDVTFDAGAQELVWTIDPDTLEVGETIEVTYVVTVNAADALADGLLINAVTGPPNCPDPAITDPADPAYDPDCVTITGVAAWTAAKGSDREAQTVAAGDRVTYEIVITNTGGVDLADLSVSDDLSGVLDDATYDGNATVASGPGFVQVVGSEQIVWEGDLAVGEVATITYSVTVAPASADGDGVLLNALTGGGCDAPPVTDPGAPGYDPDCVPPPPLVSEWVGAKSSGAAGDVEPGQTVTYTITVENTGAVDQVGISYTDDLADVLDDAAYGDDAQVVSGPGSVVFDEPAGELVWTGDLGVGESAVVEYSVTVNAADALGDGEMANAITGPPNCPDPAITDAADPAYDPDCVSILLVVAYTVAKDSTAPNDPVLPGDVVDYTVTVTNTGGVDLAGADAATFSDDLSGVLDDAAFNEDEQADTGTVAFVDPVIDWEGDLAVGEVATITYSVTVDQPIEGDHLLVNAVTGGDCPDPAVTDPQAPDFDPDCVTVDALPSVHVEKVIFGDPVEELAPGDTFEYVITVENTGALDLASETITDDLSEVLDDAELDETSLTADVGTATFADPEITWTGDLAVGQTATIRYTITIAEPSPGDGELSNGVVGSVYSNCAPPDPTDPACWAETPIPNVVVRKEIVGDGTPAPGDVVTYRITAENRGGATAVGEELVDDLSDVLDDASFNDDAVATLDGELSYDAPTLRWVGDIAPGERLELRYSVTVSEPTEAADGVLDNTVVGGTNCATDNPECTSVQSVALPAPPPARPGPITKDPIPVTG